MSGKAKHVPQRQCIGCGRKGPQSEFIRLTLDQAESPPRVLIADRRHHQGRGAYLCPRLACLDQALRRKAFARAFRQPVNVNREEIASAMTAEAVR